jgi:hypothetical protein
MIATAEPARVPTYDRLPGVRDVLRDGGTESEFTGIARDCGISAGLEKRMGARRLDPLGRPAAANTLLPCARASDCNQNPWPRPWKLEGPMSLTILIGLGAVIGLIVFFVLLLVLLSGRDNHGRHRPE